MKKIVFISIIILVLGCKNINKNRKMQNDTEMINNYLEVILKIKILEDDIFEIFFAENIKDNYTAKNKIKSTITGNEDFQHIVFKLPNRTYPLKLRIDLGANNNETPIEIEQIKLSTGKNFKIFHGKELKKYFRINNYIINEPDSNIYFRIKINEKYDPYLLSTDLSKIISDLFSG
ncbi:MULTISPECIES: hypothetical protein [unclassified Arenibacter]|uniref:hypothetical protein n=1 Tax=unclassified Arenibacter TaxID=2615047 RepID=UPI000E352991|nr:MULTISPECIES: hypothetical protein [unclassified Arenibacter]MCM4161970.1 hypothetical protein [Arenibacter sp. A80]RFT57602.1 hypothetical protein D0S24_00030 [Arenibacter sp. P308M17]